MQVKAQNAVIAIATASIYDEELCIFCYKIVGKPIRFEYSRTLSSAWWDEERDTLEIEYYIAER